MTDRSNHVSQLELLRGKAKRGTITLVYAARDEQHNAAVALKAFLERR